MWEHRAFFVTGTGTDIGKTWLTCALIRYWCTQGCRVRAFKPVLSGFDRADALASDAGQLLTAMNQPISKTTLDVIAPWRFSAPLSPDRAAVREGKEIDFGALVSMTRQCLSANRHASDAERVDVDAGVTLIEGIGGVMVPLDAKHTVRDWISASGFSCILVAGSYLGSLSHTLTALEALQKVGVDVTAIVVNESPQSVVSLDDTLTALQPHVGGVNLVPISRAAPQAGIEALAFLLS
jgi:dethiobiotin synthetase